MSEELKCEKHFRVKASGSFCPICLLDERDALRAELAASQAEVERLRGIIHKVEWVNPPARVGTYCLHCAMPKDHGHHKLCPFYQWEANHA